MEGCAPRALLVYVCVSVGVYVYYSLSSVDRPGVGSLG